MNLLDMRARVREDLQDTVAADYVFSNDEVDGAIERVVGEFSLVYPLQKLNEITTTADSKELDISSLDDILKIVSVEYPMDYTPPNYQRIEEWADKLYMTDEGDGTKKARVRWHTWHTLAGVTAWAVATAYALGDIVIPTTSNGYWYECTTAGTSHAATEPTWPTTGGGTVSDGATLVWTCHAPTIPSQFNEIIVLGATGYLAKSASVYTVNKLAISGRYSTINYSKWGQTRLHRYELQLKAISRDNRVLTKELYSD